MSQYYLPFTLWNLFKCGKRFAEALVGKRKEMMACREWRGQAVACSLFGEDAAYKWKKKKWVFPGFSSLPGSWTGVRFTVGFQRRTQLLSTFGRHWLRYDSTGKVFQLGCASSTRVLSNRQIQLSSDFTSAVVNIYRTMRMKLAYTILPAACTVWLWNILEICSIEIKIVLTTGFRGYRLLTLTFLPPPVPSHFVPICIQIFNQCSGLRLCTGFNQKSLLNTNLIYQTSILNSLDFFKFIPWPQASCRCSFFWLKYTYYTRKDYI